MALQPMIVADLSVDPAVVFVLMLVIIVVGWSVLNRWEAEKRRRKTAAESRSVFHGESDEN